MQVVGSVAVDRDEHHGRDNKDPNLDRYRCQNHASDFNTLAAMNIGDDGRPGPAEQGRRMAIAMVAAHAVGGLVVFALLGFVMPVPEVVQDDYGLTLIQRRPDAKNLAGR